MSYLQPTVVVGTYWLIESLLFSQLSFLFFCVKTCVEELGDIGVQLEMIALEIDSWG